MLPHNLNLSRKRVIGGYWCLTCEEGVEDDWHCMFDCQQPCFWANLPFYHLFDKLKNLKFAGILQLAVDDLDVGDFEIFVVCVWSAWYKRNKMVIGEVKMEGRVTDYDLWAKSFLDLFKSA